MMMLTRSSFAPNAALIYVTVGALLDAWTAVYYFAFGVDSVDSQATFFWLVGLFLTGLILMVIGFTMGQIGRAARQAEPPPAVVATAALVETDGTPATPSTTAKDASLAPPTQPAAPVSAPRRA